MFPVVIAIAKVVGNSCMCLVSLCFLLFWLTLAEDADYY